MDETSVAMPAFLPLRYQYPDREARGAIFVLLDGILLFADDARLRDAWMKRLRLNEQRCGVIRKVTHAGRINADSVDCVYCQQQQGASKGCVEEGGTTLAGVRLLPAGGYEPATPYQTATRAGSSTWRDIAATLGNLLWRIRVHSAGVYPDRAAMPLVNEEAHLGLWHEVGTRGCSDGWDTQVFGVDWKPV